MISIYEGNKENCDCIESIFGNLVNNIQDTCENIKSLPLRSHKICPNSPSTCSSHIVQSTDKELLVSGASHCPSEITRLNRNNVNFSNSFKLCRKYRTDSNPPQNLKSNPDRNRDDPEKDQNVIANSMSVY